MQFDKIAIGSLKQKLNTGEMMYVHISSGVWKGPLF